MNAAWVVQHDDPDTGAPTVSVTADPDEVLRLVSYSTVAVVTCLKLWEGAGTVVDDTTTPGASAMPFVHTCTDHPQWEADAVDGVNAHLADAHPGVTFPAAGLIDVNFITQAQARGITPTRVFACRVCATRVSTTDPDREPYCDTHLPEAS